MQRSGLCGRGYSFLEQGRLRRLYAPLVRLPGLYYSDCYNICYCPKIRVPSRMCWTRKCSRPFGRNWACLRNRWLAFSGYRLRVSTAGKAATPAPPGRPLTFIRRLMPRFVLEPRLRQFAKQQIVNAAHFCILCFEWLMPARGGRDELPDCESSTFTGWR